MALASTQPQQQLSGWQPASSEATRFPQSVAPVHDLNENFLALLVELSESHSAAQEYASYVKIGRMLCDAGSSTRDRLALCPFLLLDAGLRCPIRWQQPTVERKSAQDVNLPAELSPNLLHLAQVTCAYAWHLVRTDPVAARLVLGASPECSDGIARMGLTDLQQLAERIVRERWLKPRWHDRPHVWRRLVRLAQSTPRRAFVSVNIRGRQLFLGDDLLLDETQ